MFRQMRRAKQQLSAEECQAVLKNGLSGTLALSGDEGYPYAVPMSYLYSGGKIYFHGSLTGHKTDALKNSDKVSFCVVAQDEPNAEKLTTLYRSVIVFGRARLLESDAEKREALELLCEKYCTGFMENARQAITRQLSHLHVIELTPEHISGKQAFELVLAKQNADRKSI